MAQTLEDEPIMAVHDAAALIMGKSYHLHEIARSLDRVGMRDLADELLSIADDIHSAAECARRGASLDGKQRLDQSVAETGEILSLLLRRCTIDVLPPNA
jgi:hypothetical protein